MNRTLLLCLFSVVPTLMFAQTPPAPNTPPKKASKRAATKSVKSSNVKAGTLVSLDAAAEKLSLKEKNGQETTFTLTEKTRFLKNRREATAGDFKPGENVVVHLRKSRKDDSRLVTELTDPLTWTWLSDLRKKTTQVTLTEIGEDSITTAVPPDNAPMNYLVSEKTLWFRSGKEASPSLFKAGEKVFVVPRSLPGGGIMARVIADTEAGAAQMKERQARSVHGTVLAMDLKGRTLSLKSLTGDKRSLQLGELQEYRSGGKSLPLTSLKTGAAVVVQIKRDEANTETAARISLDTARSRKSRPSPTHKVPK